MDIKNDFKILMMNSLILHKDTNLQNYFEQLAWYVS